MMTAQSHFVSSRSLRESGLSLVELLVASAILSVVLLAIYTVYDVGVQDYARGTARVNVQQNTRVALESIARELRMAGHSASNLANADCASPPCAVTALTLSSVTFQSELDGDAQTEKVIYAFVPPVETATPCDLSNSNTVGRITRSTQTWDGTAWSPAAPSDAESDIAQCIKALTFTYYDNSGNSTTTVTSVRRVRISITGEETTRGWGSRAYALSSDVSLRNPS